MSPLLALARIKVSGDVAVVIMAIGGILIGTLLLVLLMQKIGKKGAAIVGAVIFAGLVFWMINGARLSAHHDRLYEIDSARAARVRASLANVPATPLETACASAGPWDLKTFALTYVPNMGTEKNVRVVTFSHSGEGLYGDDNEAYLWKGRGMFEEALNLGPPGGWSRELESSDYYPLSRLEVALHAEGTRAAVVELESGKVLCAGTLPQPFGHNGYGGFGDNANTFFIALRPLCKRLGAETCGRMDKKAY